MRRLTTSGILRATAIIIALTAALDPAITANRRGKPDVAVIAANPRADSTLANRVARALGGKFTVYRSPMPAAAGTVIVGNAVPRARGDLVRPVFAVLPARDVPAVALEDVRAPAWSPRETRVPVRVVARVTGARGRTVDVALRSGGLVVDRVTRAVANDDARIDATLGYVAPAPGAAPLRVSASVQGVSGSADADVVVDVRDARWAVLFFDPRPSWQSTFVRRAIERDPRFVVTSRVVTSRNVSADAGQPPGRLDDFGTLSLYDAVLVGAPEALGERDVAGLETFLRRRGGSVVLLLDNRAPGGAPYDQLTGAGAWTIDSVTKAASIVTGDGPELKATQLAWPTSLPVGAEAIARTPDSLRATVAARPVVWRAPVGAGQLIVSGALDAWRFRDRPAPAFDRFWQTLVATAAASAPPALDVKVSSAALTPGERGRVSVTVRDAALSAARPALSMTAAVSAFVEQAAGDTTSRVAVSLFPDGAPGVFAGVIDAPSTPGAYRLVVSTDADRASVPLIVAHDASHASRGEPDLLAAWVAANGGRATSASELGKLASMLDDAIVPTPRLERWNPMRSAWWIVPFALALSGEWWMRRRRGQA